MVVIKDYACDLDIDFNLYALTNCHIHDKSKSNLICINIELQKDTIFGVDCYRGSDIPEYNSTIIEKEVKKIKGKRVQMAWVNGKIARNDLCPCCSGEKFKKCCGR